MISLGSELDRAPPECQRKHAGDEPDCRRPRPPGRLLTTVDGHVGELVAGVIGSAGVHDLCGLLWGEPLEDLEQLPDRAGQRQRQDRGELLPFPLAREGAPPQLVQRRVTQLATSL